LVTVGALVERKGFHRVIELLPALRERFPGLTYLVVGGASPEGDWTDRLKQQAASLGLADAVRFLGPVAPEELRVPLSAADVFVLATRNEGWANVLLEAMGCGIPVVATDVGGNAEVVNSPGRGVVVPFGDAGALQCAIEGLLTAPRDADPIRAYAGQHTWERQATTLLREFRSLTPVQDGDKPSAAEIGHA
jgi:glycosyltransferase involved in cell wall biosynthesis